MFKFLKDRKKKDNKGFTLVELVIVVAILAILVGILAPQYTKYVERSRKSADASNLENMVRSIEIAAADASATLKPGTYTITIGKDETKVTPDGDDGTAAKTVLKEFVGDDVLETTLKSSDWGQDNIIKATIVIESNYKTTVTYEPDALKEFVGKKASATPTPTPEG